MHIISLTSENVKRLKAVRITPNADGLVIVGGENGNGKTSVLDSIHMALGGASAIPGKPVREGAEKAVIVADLGDIVVTRTITAAGMSSLTVKNKDGLKYPSPQSLLDGLIGRLSFDPLAFTRLDSKTQLETLRRLVGLDFTEDNKKRERAYTERTAVNSQIRQLESRIATMPHHPDVNRENVGNLDELNATLERANANNNALDEKAREIERLKEKKAEADGYIAKCEAYIADLEQKIAATRAKMAQTKEQNTEREMAIADLEATLATSAKIDTKTIVEEMQVVQRRARQLDENKNREDALQGLADLKQSAAALTKIIEDIDKAKTEKLAATKFPVEGLSFSDSGVLFNGVPFDQASAAEKIRVSVAIGAALNPKVRVICVRDGSLLDAKSMAMLEDLAKTYNLQVWVERVGKGKECTVVLEDGEIATSSAAAGEGANE